MMKFILIIMVLWLFISCNTEQNRNIDFSDSDSLTVLIKEKIKEKQLLFEARDQFENSRYFNAVLKYKSIIKKYSKRYGFDWRLIVAQIMQESRFREGALSRVGATGLMQIMPGTAREISSELDIQYIFKNPRENIAAGIYHLKKQYRLFPNADNVNRTKLTLAAYNCGVGRIYDAQDIAKYYKKSPNKWNNVKSYISRLRAEDWELHLQVWPQGKPKHGFFYGYTETIDYVENIWDMYQVYRRIL